MCTCPRAPVQPPNPPFPPLPTTPGYQAYPIFGAKIDSIAPRYAGVRRVRSDGNCFFRAATFAFLEWLLVNEAEAECQRWGRGSGAGEGGVPQECPRAGWPRVYEHAADQSGSLPVASIEACGGGRRR